ncbi:hypothetical protein MMC07_000710 [Pseudocyphellaria aurata]|nr:hypothetical protein [Pseudocyphellaria aurata]
MTCPIRVPLFILFLTIIPFSLTQSSSPCPLRGPDFPPPTTPSHSHAVQNAKQNLTSSLQAALLNATAYSLQDFNATSFSLDVYSIHEQQSLFTYHFSAPALAHPTQGVATVDSNTIYRIGSASKLLTVYTYLVEAGDVSFNHPITEYVPELASYAASHAAALQSNEIDFVDWNSVTVGALASQLAGIPRDFAPGATSDAYFSSVGLPPVPAVNASFCGGDQVQLPCDRAAFFSSFFVEHPIEPSFATPIYSNVAYQLLAYALTNITSKPFPELFDRSLRQPLKLDSTSYGFPKSNASSIIPINASISWYDVDLLDESPAGAYYSSIRDLRALGISILNSSLLRPAQTRRWMKPASFTADPDAAVGAPWEILRAPTDRQSWMYTKNGAIGLYASNLALLSDYDVGFTVLAAGTGAYTNVNILSNLLAETIVPALETAAREEAGIVYAGSYEVTGAEGANSSMTVVVDDQKPGLGVTKLIYNGADVFSYLGGLLGAGGTTEGTVSVRLYPTSLRSITDGVQKVGWRAVYELLSGPTASEASRDSCISWANVDQVTYGGVGIDEFVFEIGGNGKATSVEPRVLRSRFARTNSSRASQGYSKMRAL